MPKHAPECVLKKQQPACWSPGNGALISVSSWPLTRQGHGRDQARGGLGLACGPGGPTGAGALGPCASSGGRPAQLTASLPCRPQRALRAAPPTLRLQSCATGAARTPQQGWCMLGWQGRRRGAVRRPLQPSDFASLKAAHAEMFPIDYEDTFYDAAVHSREGIFSWAATLRWVPARLGGPCPLWSMHGRLVMAQAAPGGEAMQRLADFNELLPRSLPACQPPARLAGLPGPGHSMQQMLSVTAAGDRLRRAAAGRPHRSRWWASSQRAASACTNATRPTEQPWGCRAACWTPTRCESPPCPSPRTPVLGAARSWLCERAAPASVTHAPACGTPSQPPAGGC